jgi:hypothetical protein
MIDDFPVASSETAGEGAKKKVVSAIHVYIWLIAQHDSYRLFSVTAFGAHYARHTT